MPARNPPILGRRKTIPLPLDRLPEGSQQNGYKEFVVQDLKT